jgi:uncharacterized repeat protein (TIGR03803 family)
MTFRPLDVLSTWAGARGIFTLPDARSKTTHPHLKLTAAVSIPALLLCFLAVLPTPVGAQTGVEVTLHTFNAYGDGSYPRASLIQGLDGDYYGTTDLGGTNGAGTIFKLSQSGRLTTLHSFVQTSTDTGFPQAPLIQDTDGTLYGTTTGGGGTTPGQVFKIKPNGAGFTVLCTLDVLAFAPVMIGQDGKLYGTCSGGGAFGGGFVYSVNKDGSAYTLLHSFAGTDGSNPASGVIQARDGYLYGTTSAGGPLYGDDGVVYKLATDGTHFQVIRVFSNANNAPAAPWAGLVQGKSPDDMLYGTTRVGGATASCNGCLYAISTDGTTFSILNSYDYPEGITPITGLIQGSDGRLYGTTTLGGPHNYNGSVYAVTTAGALDTLFSFGPSLTSGQNPIPYYGDPYGGVIQGSDGRLHGSLQTSRANENENNDGYYAPLYVHPNLGALFSIGTDGSHPTIDYDFSTKGFHDGQTPLYGALARDATGNLYGTTSSGGEFYDGGPYTNGTLWRLAPNGAYTILHSFCGWQANGPSDGDYPEWGVALYGNVLYGTTADGGTNGGIAGGGTLFSYDLASRKYTVLYSFGGTNDGNEPSSAPVLIGNTLYGVTAAGGANFGTVYAFTLPTGTTPGSERVLYAFQGSSDGATPTGNLLLGQNGNLYGITTAGGTGDTGTLFEITPSGAFTVVHQFGSGDQNCSGLTQDSNGVIYGVTGFQGNQETAGCAFSMNPDGTNYTVLHSFIPTASNPATGCLTLGADGMLYGTTITSPTGGPGSVYRMAKDGSQFDTVYTFHPDANNDGGNPLSALLQSPDGALYGLCSEGGVSPYPGTYIAGTIFRLTPPPVLNSLTFSPASVTASAESVGTVTFSSRIPAGGAVVIVTANASCVAISSTFKVPAGHTSFTFGVRTSAVTVATPVVVTATYGSTITTGTFTVLPVVISNLSVAPSSVLAGKPSQGTVTLASPALEGGTVVSLGSNNSAATVPASVTVPRGKTAAKFTIKTTAQSSQASVQITASLNGTSANATLTVNPTGLIKLLLSPSAITGSAISTGTLHLSSPAPAGGLIVSLVSGNACAVVPATVAIPAGNSSMTFRVKTTTVATSTIVPITATCGSTSVSANITVNPK